MRRATAPRRPAAKKRPWKRALGTFATFHFVAAAWVFFRCGTVGQALDVFRVLASGTVGAGNLTLPILAAVVAGLAGQLLPEGWLPAVQRRFVLLPAAVQASALLAVAALVRAVGGSAISPFIYFAF